MVLFYGWSRVGSTEDHTQVVLEQLEQGNIFANHREVDLADYQLVDYTRSICMIACGDIHSN